MPHDPRLRSRCEPVGGLIAHWLEATDGGGAPPAVLIHGVGVSVRNMEGLARRLVPDLAPYVPDLPGHGQSGDPGRVLDTAELGAWVAAWMDATEIGPSRIVGQSYGCQVAVELAVAHPDKVDRMVLAGPTVDAHARGWAPQLWGWLRNGAREQGVQQRLTFQGWREAGLRRVVAEAGNSIAHRMEDRLPLVDAPVLVVRGERDPIVSARWAREATDLLADGQLVTIPDAPHTVTTTDPERLAERIRPFLLAEG